MKVCSPPRHIEYELISPIFALFSAPCTAWRRRRRGPCSMRPGSSPCARPQVAPGSPGESIRPRTPSAPTCWAWHGIATVSGSLVAQQCSPLSLMICFSQRLKNLENLGNENGHGKVIGKVMEKSWKNHGT